MVGKGEWTLILGRIPNRRLVGSITQHCAQQPRVLVNIDTGRDKVLHDANVAIKAFRSSAAMHLSVIQIFSAVRYTHVAKGSVVGSFWCQRSIARLGLLPVLGSVRVWEIVGERVFENQRSDIIN